MSPPVRQPRYVGVQRFHTADNLIKVAHAGTTRSCWPHETTRNPLFRVPARTVTPFRDSFPATKIPFGDSLLCHQRLPRSSAPQHDDLGGHRHGNLRRRLSSQVQADRRPNPRHVLCTKAPPRPVARASPGRGDDSRSCRYSPADPACAATAPSTRSQSCGRASPKPHGRGLPRAYRQRDPGNR